MDGAVEAGKSDYMERDHFVLEVVAAGIGGACSLQAGDRQRVATRRSDGGVYGVVGEGDRSSGAKFELDRKEGTV